VRDTTRPLIGTSNAYLPNGPSNRPRTASIAAAMRSRSPWLASKKAISRISVLRDARAP